LSLCTTTPSSTLYQIHLRIRYLYFSSDNATEPYVQEQFLREIPGLAVVEIVAPGYCIEYAFIDPRQLRPTLESGMLPAFWLAEQINGTTSYDVRVWRAVVPLRRWQTNDGPCAARGHLSTEPAGR
jgi:hypothetical protein